MADSNPRLEGHDNYASWHRWVTDTLIIKGLGEYISKTIDEVLEEIDEMFTFPSSTPSEDADMLALEKYKMLDKVRGEGRRARHIILTSLDPSVRWSFSAEKQAQDPKDILQFLEDEFASEDITQVDEDPKGIIRDCEIYARLWDTQIKDGEDPIPTLSAARDTLEQLGRKVIASQMTVDEYFETMTAYMLYNQLPANMEQAKRSLQQRGVTDPQKIISEIRMVYRIMCQNKVKVAVLAKAKRIPPNRRR